MKTRRRGPSTPSDSLKISPSPEDRMFMDFDRTLKADEVLTILEGAIHDGDLTDQARLFAGMLDTWPDLGSAIEKMQEGVCQAKLEFVPASKKNEEPTDEAIKVASLVEASWEGMVEDPIYQNSGASSTLSNLASSYYTGHSVSEILWERKTLDGQEVWAPNSTMHLDAQFYGYPQNTAEDGRERLILKPEGERNPSGEIEFKKHQFLVAVRKNHIGHPANSAPLRSLVGYWLAFNWGLKWLMQHAQIFGIPIRWANYGTAGDKQAVEKMLKNIGSSAWGAFPSGATLNIHEPSSSAATLPQSVLIEMANRAVSIFISGETLTADVANSGSRALGDVHATTGHKKLCSVINHVKQVINSQYIPAFLHWNKIDPKLAPTYALPKEEESEEEGKTKAERLKIVLREVGVKAPKAWVHKELGVPMAKEGDEIFEPTEGEELDEEEETEEKEGAPIKDKKKNSEKVDSSSAEDSSELIEKLAADVAEATLGIEKKWLKPVIPIFQGLYEKSQDSELSDSEFIEALESADAALPGMDLDVEHFAGELEKILATGLISGGSARL